MVNERQIQQAIRLQLGSRPDVRLFRSNTGQAWIGDVQRVTTPGPIHLRPGDVVLRNARPFQAGLCKGAPDLIGWRAWTVTEADVGTTVARFAGIEVKGPRGRASAEQLQFLSVLRQHGGLGDVARSVEDAQRALRLDLGDGDPG